MKMTRILIPSLLILACCGSALAEPVVSVRDHGAKGDGVTDDTAAIRAALQASRSVHFPAGVYVLTDGIVLPPSARLTGEGAPMLGTFPMKEDDKRFLRSDRLTQMPGTTLLFKGRGRQTLKTPRQDLFSDLRFAVKTTPMAATSLQGLAIALDVQVFDADGKLTTPENDQRADYDAGLLIDDSAAGTVRDVTVYGFWKKAGLCLLSRGMGDNPDYNTFWNCSFMGEHGVAILGFDEEEGPGLSGTQFYGCRIFANDHHQRSAQQWGSAALLIDGNTSAKRADINGHYFFGGCIRTYAPIAVRLDHASNVSFHGVVFELPSPKGSERKGAGKVVGTANTRDAHFFGCRMHDIGLNELGRAMEDGVLVVFPDAMQGVSVHQNGRVARLTTAIKFGPSLQLTDDGSSVASGWRMTMDAGKLLSLAYKGRTQASFSPTGELQANAVETPTVRASAIHFGAAKPAPVTKGSAKVTGSRMKLSSATPATLETLEGGSEGQLLILEAGPESAPIEVSSSDRGNIQLARPIEFSAPSARLTLLRSGPAWVELSRTAITP